MERAQLRKVIEDTGCAEFAGDFLFLCDPAWRETERCVVTALKQRACVGDVDASVGWICVPTGGTSGGLRFARHDEETFTAAVEGFCEFFGLDRVNAVDVLPAFHVSGLMSRVRSAATGGKYLAWNWKDLEAGRRPKLERNADGWVISLVPTQLQRLLAGTGGADWLQQFRTIFIGGGPTWPALEHEARLANLPVALTYGMSETAAMVAALEPKAFLAGASRGATVLPHARCSLSPEGAIQIAGDSVFRGYFPEQNDARMFETSDLGAFDKDGALIVLGRRDAAIITGGKKVQPQEVEAALRATGQFADVAVAGIPDPEWGEVVAAFYPVTEVVPDLERVERGIAGTLAAHQRPKRYIPIGEWPRNAQGKVNRATLLAAVAAARSGLRP